MYLKFRVFTKYFTCSLIVSKELIALETPIRFQVIISVSRDLFQENFFQLKLFYTITKTVITVFSIYAGKYCPS